MEVGECLKYLIQRVAGKDNHGDDEDGEGDDGPDYA